MFNICNIQSLPVSSVDLSHDLSNAGVDGLVVEVAGLPLLSGAVYVQVERVKTPAVRHHPVKQTETLTLLQSFFFYLR